MVDKVGSDEMGYVYDAPIHYVVLNRKDNNWNFARINQYLALLDQIEASEDGKPAVMVTIGTGTKIFSSGFDLVDWAPEWNRMKTCIPHFHEVMARLLEFPMPTLCVYNGKALAGGCIFGLSHDSRIMNAETGSICLSEILIGLPLTPPYISLVAAKLEPKIALKASYAFTFNVEDALKDKLIDDKYSGQKDLESQISGFANRFAQFGAFREAIKTNKTN